ncbi:MAG: PAS domain S-box protein [Deltaproteobacteria bacterium]|nr:PAS domain S-box protein [Deltaproteobacteria bacterium]
MARRGNSQAERQLAEDQDRIFRILIESVTDLIAIIEPDGTLRYVSPSHEHVLGHRPDDLVGKNAFDLVHPDDRDDLLLKFTRGIAAAESTDTGEFRYRCADGSWRAIEGIGRNLLGDSIVRGIVVTSRDVSERRRRELEVRLDLERRVEERTAEIANINERLRTSEQRYRELVETVHDVVYAIDPTGQFTYLSPAIYELTGYTPDELLGRHFSILVPEEERPEVFAQFELALADRMEPIEHRIATKSGTSRWVRSLARRIQRSDGAIELRGVASDVTDRRSADEKRREQQAELAHVQRMATMGQMAAELAHEINQPLGAIVNYADGLAVRMREGKFDTVELHAIAQRVADEARRAAAVLRRVRDFVGNRSPSLETCDINEIVSETAQVLETDARNRQVTLRLRLATPLPQMVLDRVQIRQVLVNLIRNAVEAVVASSPERRLVEVETVAIGTERVHITVRDSGVGLPQVADRIFEAFFTTKPGGLGMGLAISRSIVEAHHGQLWAEPNAAGGAIFHLELPVASRSRATGRSE